MNENVSLFDLVGSLAMAMDLIDPKLANHHFQVSYISYSIAEEYDLSEKSQRDLIIAGAVHDIGAIKLQERLELKEEIPENPHYHSELGYRLLMTFDPFKEIADIVRFHHIGWKHGEGRTHNGCEVPFESRVLNIADRISALIDCNKPILEQTDHIKNRIDHHCGSIFHPDLVNVFHELANREFFWLDILSDSLKDIIKGKMDFQQIELPNTLDLAKLFSRVIDFRSEFTATHSSGIAAVALAMGELLEYPVDVLQKLELAGYLHDLGKLAIPAEILEKPAKLSKDDILVMRAHSYYTYRILSQLNALEDVVRWASNHHEKINGRGYPFHIKGEDMSLHERILAVADIFTALTENRPYRKGAQKTETMQIMKKMVDHGALDGKIVEFLDRHYEVIDQKRRDAQNEAKRLRAEFFEEIGK